jgi:hypothetical protein
METLVQAIKVEDLAWFPFKTFQEFKTAHREGLCRIWVDRSGALEYVRVGKYVGTSTRLLLKMLLYIPHIAVILFLVYAVGSGSWLLLLALPLFVVAYVLFHPSTQLLLGLLRTISIGLSLLGFFWGILSGAVGLVAITAVLLTIWLVHLAFDRKSTQILIHAVTEHEDILCATWRNRLLTLRLADGRTVFVDSVKV